MEEWVLFTDYNRDKAKNYYFTGDFNGDGKTDLIAFYKYDSGNSKISFQLENRKRRGR